MSLKNKYKEFWDKLNQSDSVAIVVHHNPDGDAMGGALGLANLLGEKAKVVVPNAYPITLNWLPGVENVIDFEVNPVLSSEIILKAQVLIMVDFNTPSRVKKMEKLIVDAKAFKIMIDHHPFPNETGVDLVFSETQVSSSCELISDIIDKGDQFSSVTPQIAMCLYTGIITDTGSLSHNSSRPETYLLVAKLLQVGFNKDWVLEQIFQKNRLSQIQLLGFCLSQRLIKLEGYPVAYISLSANDLIQFDYQQGDTEGVVNYPLCIEGISVSALFIEKDDLVKLSLRSKGNLAVNKLSEKYFGGGGHLNAAGGESKLSLAETIVKFETAAKEMIDEISL